MLEENSVVQGRSPAHAHNGAVSANGHITDASTLFSPAHRRTTEVNIAPPGCPAEVVIVRAVSAGERRKLFAKTTRPWPTDEDPNATVLNREWYASGLRSKVLVALTVVAPDGSYLFPGAVRAAHMCLDSDGSVMKFDGLEELEELDPVAEVLIVDAAVKVCLLDTDSIMAVQKGLDPLAPAIVSSSSSPSPSESPIQTSSSVD